MSSWNLALRRKAKIEQDRRRDDPSTYTTPLRQSKANGIDGNTNVQKFVMDYMNTIDSTARRAWRKEQLVKYPQSVARQYQVLVEETATVLHDDFWQRYEYRCADVSRIIADWQEEAGGAMESASAPVRSLSSSSSVRSTSSGSFRRLLGGGGRKFRKSSSNKSTSALSDTPTGGIVRGSSNKDNNDKNNKATTWLNVKSPSSSLSLDIGADTTFDSAESFKDDEGGMDPAGSNTQVLNVTDSLFKDVDVPIVVSMPDCGGEPSLVVPMPDRDEEVTKTTVSEPNVARNNHTSPPPSLEKTVSFKEEVIIIPNGNVSEPSLLRGIVSTVLWCIVLIGLIVFSLWNSREHMTGLLCGPIRPGVQIVPLTQGSPTRVSYQSPWWAPMGHKQVAFDVVCGSVGNGLTELIVDHYPRKHMFSASIVVHRAQEQLPARPLPQQQPKRQQMNQLWKESRLQSLTTDGSFLNGTKLSGKGLEVPVPWAAAPLETQMQ